MTGGVSGLIVLDVDPPHGGDDSLADLERRHGRLPDTPRVLTGGGGLHLYFQHPGGSVACSAGALGCGLDVRADGGYIVAPPSRHASGRHYTWELGAGLEDVPPASVPAWLLGRLTARGDRLKRDGTPLVIAAGARNRQLAQLGGLLRRHGVGEAAIAACLAAVNRHHCQPPLEGDEVRKIAASVSRYAPGLTVPEMSEGASRRSIEVEVA